MSSGKAIADHADAKHDFELDEKFPKWRGWHPARRGLGSNLFALGVPEKVIQQILRHANVSTTGNLLHQDFACAGDRRDGKLQGALPESLTGLEVGVQVEEALSESLSGNEVATQEQNAAASSAVN